MATTLVPLAVCGLEQAQSGDERPVMVVHLYEHFMKNF
jgi:hypothetical protein